MSEQQDASQDDMPTSYSPSEWPLQPASLVDQVRDAYARGTRSFSNWKLAGVDLSKAQLSGANFFAADLRGANLNGADLSGATLSQANLTGASLSGANLRNAYLEGANLIDANLSSSALYGATLTGAYIAGANLSGAFLGTTSMAGVIRDRPAVVSSAVPPATPAPPTMRFCMYCGAGMPTGVTYCPNCGKAQPAMPDSAVASTPAVPSSPSPWPSAYAPPAVLTTNPVSSSAGLGAHIADYPGSPVRFIWVGLGGAVAAFGLLASLVPISLAGLLFWGAVGAACFAYYYYFLRNLKAQVFERGFIITRGDKTTSGRWEDIANVEHWVRQTYVYGFIPTGKRHSYNVILRNGERVKLTSSFQDVTKLTATIQHMWAQAVQARSNQQQA